MPEHTQKTEKSPFYGAKTGKDDFQVLVGGDGVQFADKENVLRRPHICIGEISHLQQRTDVWLEHRLTSALVSRGSAICPSPFPEESPGSLPLFHLKSPPTLHFLSLRCH